MPRFKVIQYRDAVVRYEVELEASSAEAAIEHAKTQDCAWVEYGMSAYDSADIEVCDLDGNELIPSHQVWWTHSARATGFDVARADFWRGEEKRP